MMRAVPWFLPLLLTGTAHAADAPPTPPSWNGHARQFIWPPAFDLSPVRDAKAYRFTLQASDRSTKTFEADAPSAPLTPVWNDLPPGTTTVRVEGLNATGGRVIGLSGASQFHRAAAFTPGAYAAPALPYDQSAHVALDTVLHEPYVRSWLTTGRPDPQYPLYRYAAKVIGSLVGGCATAGSSGDPDALAIGRRAADYLIGISAPAGSPLEFFPPTYHDAKPTERENDHWTMLMTPAEAGQGYLDLYDATRDEKYLAAARRIADTYAKLQLPDGTWPLKVDNRTGSPVSDVELIPSAVIDFLDRLGRQYDIQDHRLALDRAIQWMMLNPVRTFDWKAQFDDAKVRGPYENLSKHEATAFAAYLFRTAADDPAKVAVAEGILRWSEDQFVIWDHPPDLAAPPPRDERLRVENWFTPCSAEQYAMFEPVSGSSAFMIVAYVRAFETTGKKPYLEKADALADALTVAQEHHHGRYPTRMIRDDLTYWINSTINTARAMQALADCHHRQRKSQ